MSKSLFKKLYPMLGVALSLSLTACPAPNTTETETPTEVSPSSNPTETPTSAPPSSTPVVSTSQLQLKVQGDADLEKFLVQQVQGVCLNELSSLKTTLTLPSAPGADLLAALKALNAEVSGSTVTLMTPVPNLAALVKGFELNFLNLPTGTIKGSIDLNNSAGKSLGSVGFSLEYKAGANSISVMLKPVGEESNPKGCIPIKPEITGATLTATAGGILVALPPTTTPGETAPPAEQPSSSLPAGLASLRMDVDNRYITAIGETRQLSVTLLDAAGNVLPQDGVVIEWSSNRPGDLSVDVNGKIEALVGLGYAEVSAKVSGTNLADSVLFDITDPSFFTTPTSSGGGGSGSSQSVDIFKPQGVDEFRVNDYTGNRSFQNDMAKADNGNYVVVWHDDTNSSVMGRCLDADGNPGSEFQINQTTVAGNPIPTVDMDAEGNFVVVWTSGTDGSSEGIHARRFDSACNFEGSYFAINTTGFLSTQENPEIAMNNDGGFVAVWESKEFDLGGGATYVIKGRQFDADNNAGSEFVVSESTTTGYDQWPSVAMDDNGNFVVAWSDYDYGDFGDGSYYGVLARRYNGSAEAQGDFIRVNARDDNTLDSYEMKPVVAMDRDGDFVVTWMDKEEGDFEVQQVNTEDGYNIYARRYNKSGSARDSEEFRVNSETEADQKAPHVAMDQDGNFVVAWMSYEQDGSHYGIFAQRYLANGDEINSEYQVNQETSSQQSRPRIGMNAKGEFLVSWFSTHLTAGDIMAGNGL